VSFPPVLLRYSEAIDFPFLREWELVKQDNFTPDTGDVKEQVMDARLSFYGSLTMKAG
jgi:hypothetical protein